jgi:hypothetical protein
MTKRKESQRLRDRAAAQLRQGRRAHSLDAKAVHNQRAAALKDMAQNEEWLSGDRERSRRARPKKDKT